MPENRERSAIWPIIPTGYERNRHDGFVDIIGDGLKTEEINMAETTPATSTQKPATPDYDEIFDKLDAILDKR